MMKYDVARAVVTLSVTELCNLALTSGDLDLRPGRAERFSPSRAAIGAEVHSMLQKRAGVLYDREVTLSNTSYFHGISFEVSGRADGVLRTDPLTVDEIKTVGGRQFDLPPAPMHDAQLKCYAYFLCRARARETVRTRLTYYRIEDGEIRYLEQEQTVDALKQFYYGLLARVEYRARLLIEQQTVRIPSAAGVAFPYPTVRRGQDILLKECYRDIRAGKRLFAQAPTGIGKTISTLYPAVRALGKGNCDKIFYLTAKSSTGMEAYRAAAKLYEKGARLRTVVLTSREQLCRNEAARCDPAGISRHCNPMDCPMTRGFFDRCEEALRDALSGQNGFTRTSVMEWADKYGICPYEFQLSLSELCEIVICDYNYAFDPQIYLRRYFEPEAVDSSRYVFLIDEAHNLADRACGMYSAALENTEVASLLRILSQEDKLREPLEALCITMQGMKRLCHDNLNRGADGVERGYYLSRTPLNVFLEAVEKTRQSLDQWQRTHRADPNEAAVLLLLTHLKRFLLIAEYYDERFLTFLEVEDSKRTVRLICLDLSRILDACMNRARAAVLFSATLTPTDYFADILGGGKKAVRISLPSPFDPARLCIVAVNGISTRYEDREKSYRRIASVIAATASAKAGNYIVYFPSYDYMEQVYKQFSERYPNVETVLQTRGMTAPEREAFLEAFRNDQRLRIGFCVLGGSFSEGVDLPGRRLIGTVIVGTGLPGISNERNILKEYYDVTRERGFDYAYTYPGMNRVLQAAGRVIRREEDCGMIVLVDDRYAEARYQAILPEHWAGLQYAGNSAELAEIANEFWLGIDNSQ